MSDSPAEPRTTASPGDGMKRKRFGGDGGRKRGSFGPNRFGKGTGANRTTQPTKKRELPKEGQPPAKKQKIEKKVEEEAPPGRTSNERFRATVAKAAKRNKSKLSELEIEDSLVSEDNIIDGRFSLDLLADQIKQFVPKWKDFIAKDRKGESACPVLLIASTTRCLEAQKTAKKDGFTVAKLFARHMKLEEQAEDLRKRGSLIGIGTPERILKLAQEGHLKLEKTQLVILDGVPDAKGFTIVDGNTFVPCLDFLRAAFHGPTKAEGAKFIWLEDK